MGTSEAIDDIPGDKLTFICGQGRNNSALVSTLSRFIDLGDDRISPKSLVDHSKIAERHGFLIDENINEECKKANGQVQNLMTLIRETTEVSERTKKILPLQGEHWKNISEWEREELRLS